MMHAFAQHKLHGSKMAILQQEWTPAGHLHGSSFDRPYTENTRSTIHTVHACLRNATIR